MTTRLFSRFATLLRRKPEIRIIRKLEMPREYPKRPAYIPFTGYVMLAIPGYFSYMCVYWEASHQDVYNQLMAEVSVSLEEVVDLPTE